MKYLTLLTRKYSYLLEDFCDGNLKAGNHNGLFSVSGRVNFYEVSFLDNVLAMLTDIALCENPIYQHSPKLRDMASDLYHTQIYLDLKKNLLRFFRHNQSLYLEGYVAFRMTEYREKLDMMSYSLIKKMKLIHQD